RHATLFMAQCQAIRRLRQRTADFPVMSVGIDDTAQPPSVFLAYRVDLRCTGAESTSEDSVGISYRQDDSNGTAANGLRAEVEMFGRLIAHPELCTFHGKPCHDAATFFHAKH